MKVKDILEALKNIDPELDVYVSDPDRGNIIYDLSMPVIQEVEMKNEFAWSEWDSCSFPIGYKFVNF